MAKNKNKGGAAAPAKRVGRKVEMDGGVEAQTDTPVAASGERKRTAGAMAELAVATAGGTLVDHPLQKTGKVGVYTAADGRFKIDRRSGTGFRWTVEDTASATLYGSKTYEGCRLIVNKAVAGSADLAADVIEVQEAVLSA